MLELFDGGPPIYDTIEELLEVIDSCRCTAAERLKAVSRLEEEFGKVVLASDDDPGTSTRKARNDWWDAQKRPRSCVALSLICLVHRLHLQCQADFKGKGADESDLICSQLISSFTILQGLCLKDQESQKICSRKSTLELIIDLIGAEYWTKEMLLGKNTPAHAIDLLICVTIASPSVTRLIESLQGEEVVRGLMEKHTNSKDGMSSSSGSNGRRAVTLDEVQDEPLAIKCAEFLLFLEYGSEELRVGNGVERGEESGNASSLLNESFQSIINQSYNPRRSPVMKETQKRIERHDRGRSSSPIKSRGRREVGGPASRREERIKLIKSRPIQTNLTSSRILQQDLPLVRTPVFASSPIKSAPVTRERRSVKTSLTPFVKSTSTSPRKQHTLRGRSRERSPFGMTQATAIDSPSTISSTNSSPLKAIMGPSPAVQRAQARSVSPVKKRSMLVAAEKHRKP